jgi:hypothetical protein
VDQPQVSPIVAGDVVKVVTEDYEERMALVTVVHGEFREDQLPPCINVVYVSSDPSKRDPYGQQLERMSSLMHQSAMTNMRTPGRYWVNV